jgi:hypothetical protein
MATTKKQAASKTTALVKWDEELAKQAEVAAGMEANTGGGQFFSLKSGILAWQDAPLPNNQMAVVVLDSILENVYYEGKYDPDTPQGPVCFAFGREEKTLAPHELVIEGGNQMCGASGLCSGCEMNEWGSSDVGRGKACRNTRRLALIPAGTFNQAGKFELFDDEEHFASTAIGFMKLPVTSVKGYASFVKQVAGALRRPPFGIVTKVKVVPDPKSQFKVLFEPIMNLPDELMSVIMQRHEEAKSTIDFPYQPNDEEQAPPPKRGSRAAQKPAAKARGRKY